MALATQDDKNQEAQPKQLRETVKTPKSSSIYCTDKTNQQEKNPEALTTEQKRGHQICTT